MDKRNRNHDKRHHDGKSQRGSRDLFGTLGDLHRRKRESQREQKKGDGKTRCAHCGGQLKPRGAVGNAGHLRSKCRKCGRTVWTRPEYKIPTPLVPTSKVARYHGRDDRIHRVRDSVQADTGKQGTDNPQA